MGRQVHGHQPVLSRDACPVCATPFVRDSEVGLVAACKCGSVGEPHASRLGWDGKARYMSEYYFHVRKERQMRNIEKARLERRRAEAESDRARIALADDDHPDRAEEPADSDELPIERSFEQDGLDTEPIL
jgi:hypothetical protein